MNSIRDYIVKNLIDKSYLTNSIYYSYSIIDNEYFVLHIYNPEGEEIKINDNNKPFFEKITKMLFDKNNEERGCFNHQNKNNTKLYTSAIDVVLNYFLNIEYSFILVETKTFNPISISCCIKNYIYNVCTNFDYRKQGNMEKLLNHFFTLVEKNKLKNGNHNEILLDIVYENPDYKSVKEYYENKYNFSLLREETNKTILVKKITKIT